MDNTNLLNHWDEWPWDCPSQWDRWAPALEHRILAQNECHTLHMSQNNESKIGFDTRYHKLCLKWVEGKDEMKLKRGYSAVSMRLNEVDEQCSQQRHRPTSTPNSVSHRLLQNSVPSLNPSIPSPPYVTSPDYICSSNRLSVPPLSALTCTWT